MLMEAFKCPPIENTLYETQRSKDKDKKKQRSTNSIDEELMDEILYSEAVTNKQQQKEKTKVHKQSAHNQIRYGIKRNNTFDDDGELDLDKLEDDISKL